MTRATWDSINAHLPKDTTLEADPGRQFDLHRSTQPSQPPDRYGYSHFSLFASLFSMQILKSYS